MGAGRHRFVWTAVRMGTEESEAASFRFAWSRAQEVIGSYGGTSSEVMPPDTSRGPAVPGGWVRLGARKPAKSSCRDEVATSLAALWERTGQQAFTVREVYAEMLGVGTRYAESTVFKTMQRMKAPAGRPPWIVLEHSGAGFLRSDRT